MICALHLLWIIPVSVFLGMLLVALFATVQTDDWEDRMRYEWMDDCKADGERKTEDKGAEG